MRDARRRQQSQKATRTMTAAAKSDRERGTPLQNPLKHPRVLSSVAVLICSVLSLLACGTDFSNRQVLFANSIGAALGSLSAAVSMVETCDSSTHALTFGIAVLISTCLRFVLEIDDLHEAVASAVLLAAAPLAVGVATKMPPFRKLTRYFASRAFLNAFVVYSLAFIPLLSIMAGSILLILEPEQATNLPFSTVAPTFIGISTFLILWLYFKNRSHKNGALISDETKGTAVLTAISVACTIQAALSIQFAPLALLPLLVASLLVTLLSAVFCAVADTWYAVGTGQFLMVSLDTAGLLLYFVSPLVVLLVRFVDQYGEGLHEQLTRLAKALIGETVSVDEDYSAQDLVTTGLLFLVAAGTVLGVPLVNALSPLGVHLFGWGYTHGQPNTRRIGLCIDMKDFIHTQPDTKQEIIHSLCEKLAVKDKNAVAVALNIFVTLDDLQKYPDVIKSCSSKGHAICISCSSDNALETFNEYTKVLAVKPTWCRVESRNPSLIAQVSKLHMKIAFWSTLVSVTTTSSFESTEMEKIKCDVADKQGGSFIYIQNSAADPNVMSQAVYTIVEEFSVKNESDEDGFKFLPLSLVAQEYNHMDL